MNPGERLRFEYMVRFAVGVTGAGSASTRSLAAPTAPPSSPRPSSAGRSAPGGCVRQARADAVWLYGWSRVGDTVVVLR